jgi:transcriptional regulator with GAF, ATPase, and Fis domain
MAAATSAQTYLPTPTQSRVLIASADPLFRKRLMSKAPFAEACCEEAVGGAHALAVLQQMVCDNVVLDRHLPDLDSAEVANLIQQRYPGTEVSFVDPQSISAGEAVSSVPSVTLEELNASGSNAESLTAGDIENLQAIRTRLLAAPEEPLMGMIGNSRAMQKVYGLARMVAKRDTAVLITGETGTGKELVAEAIHQMSLRSRHPFVVVNCAAIPESLFEAELFGHARGAFTGAVQARLGRIHMAQGGTLFLDEIGELPLSMQAKLLRFLQNKEVQRLGSSDVYRVDVRVVCATNVRLAELVQSKQFREDLFYRMAVFPIAVPPLRERAEDLAALSEHFLGKLCAEVEVPSKYLNSCALDLLRRSKWAGNVRELQHVLERAFILSGNESEITAEYFSDRLEMRELRES